MSEQPNRLIPDQFVDQILRDAARPNPFRPSIKVRPLTRRERLRYRLALYGRRVEIAWMALRGKDYR